VASRPPSRTGPGPKIASEVIGLSATGYLVTLAVVWLAIGLVLAPRFRSEATSLPSPPGPERVGPVDVLVGYDTSAEAADMARS